jgi:hypothetical protein
MGLVSFLYSLIFLAGLIGVVVAISIGVGWGIALIVTRGYYHIQGIPLKYRHSEKRIRRSITLITACLVMIFAITRIFGYSPSQAFRIVTGEPMPRSVKILHIKSWSLFDGKVWIHFRIAPEDLRPILAQIKERESFDDERCATDSPGWWKPEMLRYSSYSYASQYGDPIEFYVNSTLTEVYGCYYSKYRID